MSRDRFDDEDEDDRPRRPRSSRDDEDEDRPARRRRDADDEYDDGTRRGGGGAPHRGTMILIFGILGLVCCVIFGILAAIMGSNDLKEMAAGRMDRSGEGLTRVGQILGFVSVGLAILGVIIWIISFALGAQR
jgi:hypothetical protein